MPASSNAPAASKSRARQFVLTLDFFRQQLWVWPLIAAALLMLIGSWARARVDDAIKVKLKAELNAILKAEVTGLESWLVEQKKNAISATRSNDVQRLVGELLELAAKPDVSPLELASAPATRELKVELNPWLDVFQYAGWGVADANQRIIAATSNELIGKQSLPGYSEFLPKVLSGESVVSHPFPSVNVLTDETGRTAAGLPTMYAAAPIKNPEGKIIGALGFRLRPNVDFVRILSAASSGETGETFAFNRDGLLLGGSRFDEELKRLGLIPDSPDSQSILTIELRDPGLDLTKGLRPSARRSEMPLTRAVADAVQGRSGVDVDGYRDYRGVPCVAAWAWLPEYNFGIVTKIDRAEAYAPLYILRPIFWGLFGLLTASALAIFIFTVFVARLRQAARREAMKARQLGQYALDEKIGQGAMGVVYRGHHAMLRRPTAIKLIDADKTTELSIARFEREVRLTSQLNHPNTICIYDFGRTPEGIFYYAMELLDGINLDRLVRGFGPLPEGRVIYLLTQLCGSLHEAHGLGLIHRDIKPANIMLCRRGGMFDVIKLLDFGLVKAVDSNQEASLTAANAITGTPLYMSPESVVNTDAVDVHSDLYSLGAVGYFLLTGKTVFTGSSLMEICRKQVDSTPEPPSARLGRTIDPDLEAAIMRCLEKIPVARPPSAEALGEALAQCTAAGTWTSADARRWWENQADTQSGENTVPSTGRGNTVLGPVSTGL